MATLYTLYYGKSKKNMKPIMTDVLHKCENYKQKREKTPQVGGWHEIRVAEPGSDVWRQKTCTVGGNKCQSVGRVGKGPAGYIGKNGFQQHT